MSAEIIPGSFRDPSGFVFLENEVLYRQINFSYKENYEHMMSSGLWTVLTRDKKMVSHEEVVYKPSCDEHAYKRIIPERIPFISYPYEWCFSQLKVAALHTLCLQKDALSFGMTLKDASAYNIQFHHGKPILVDTLSFEKYIEGKPWVAYKQFCQHFLAPLALISMKDVRLASLFRVYPDGVPLDLASRLLPKRSYLSSMLLHIHAHAFFQRRYSAKRSIHENNMKMSLTSLKALIDSLEQAVEKLKWKPEGTEWENYYSETNYSSEAFAQKEKIVSDWLEKVKPGSLCDLGSNTGVFSRAAAAKSIFTISCDYDAGAVEKNYLQMKKEKNIHLYPLLLDLRNPTPAIGWMNQERSSFMERGVVEMALALALVHHLAISNNVPFDQIASMFAKLSKNLIIEFVPKTDDQTQKLLRSREDIFANYHKDFFEAEFRRYFEIIDKKDIANTARTLYLMKKKSV